MNFLKNLYIIYIVNQGIRNELTYKAIKMNNTEILTSLNDLLGITAHFMNEGYDSRPIIRIKYLKFKKRYQRI